jgi:glycosyltransferase involved in cell wall biosynthesis
MTRFSPLRRIMPPDPTGAGVRDILLLATADWDHPFWTNKQHEAVELARQGRRVLYVDSLGLRAPTLHRADLARIVRRLRRAFARPRQVRPGLWVWSSVRLPGQASRLVRAANKVLLRHGLNRACRLAGLQPGVLWTYSPVTCDLLDVRRFRHVLYHAVDDIAAQPGMPGARIRRAENTLAQVADVVFTTAPILQARLAEAGARHCHLHANAVDAEHFGRALGASQPEEIARLPRPRVGFVGAVSRYKVDLGLIAAVARARPGYSFVLIGRVGEGEPGADASELLPLPNVHLLGPRPYHDLPSCLSGMDVAIIPATASDYSAAMFPMKFFEYLAAGLPVVTTPLPALEAYAGLARIAPAEPATFARALDEALAGAGPSREARLQAARAHTYARRTREMLAVLDDL